MKAKKNSLNDNFYQPNLGTSNEDIELDDLELVDEENMENIVILSDDEDNEKLIDEEEMMSNNVDRLNNLNIKDDSEEVSLQNDNSVFTFSMHTGPVYSCAFHPNGEIAASGCEDETLYVWNRNNNDEFLLKDSFEDSVTLMKFSHDGRYLAVADLAGMLKVWKYAENKFALVNSDRHNQPTWLDWHPYTNVLAIIDKQHFCMRRMAEFDAAKYFRLEKSSDVGCFMTDGRNALIGYENGHAVILDLVSFRVKLKLNLHNVPDDGNSIVSVDAHIYNSIVALGSQQGQVVIYATRNRAKVLHSLHIPDKENYIEKVKFGNEHLTDVLIVVFFKYLHVYNLSRMVLRHKLALSGHGTRLILLEPYIYIGTAGNVVDIFNGKTGEKIPSLQGHTDTILDITLSKDKKRLMTTSDDGKVKIFEITIGP